MLLKSPAPLVKAKEIVVLSSFIVTVALVIGPPNPKLVFPE
ncbi:MAG: hypothetical protein ACJAYY_000986 [Paraglaciecola sp.]